MPYGEYSRNPHRLGYDMSLFIGQSQPKPSVVLLEDSLILAEVFGAGFTKAPGGKVCLLVVHPRRLLIAEVFRSNQYYELRFPRMTKAYRRRDRAWRECISLEEFQRIARETVGRERPSKEADDWCKNLFGKVASPGVKHPLRRKQRVEAILVGLERVERNYRDGSCKGKGYNRGKRKRTPDPNTKDRRPHHRESICPENAGQVIQRSPLKAVPAQKRGTAPFISPPTPTRPRFSGSFAPLRTMTNVTVNNPTTPPKSPLDAKGHERFAPGDFGKESKDSKASDPFTDEEGYKRGDRVGLKTNHPFIIPAPLPPLLPPTTAPRQNRMDLQGDTDPHTTPGDLPTNGNTDSQLTTEQTVPSLERNPQSITGGSLSTPVPDGPVKCIPPPASSPTVPGDASTGIKRKREITEDAHSHSKRATTMRSSPSVQKVPGPSRDLMPSETWSPDETTFMEEPYSKRDVSKSKSHGGNMSVDAIKARLIRATSTLQILPSKKPDTTAGNPTVEGKTSSVVYQKTLEGGAEPTRRKAASSTLTFGIPAPFPPGTSGPGSTPERFNNSDKIAAYHGADKFYSSRPPSSATPPQPPKVSESINEGGKLLVPTLGVEDTKGQNLSTGQLEQVKLEDSKKVLERFPSFVLEPQQLLFTDTAVGKLMSTSVVWFARDVGVPEPSHRPSSLQLVPRLNEVSQIESLLVACGWHRKKAFTSKRGIERGVVFVDYEEQADIQPAIRTHWVAQQCENAYRLATRYQDPTERGMKPIWIMDARVLGRERLESMKCGDALDTLEEFILWKKG